MQDTCRIYHVVSKAKNARGGYDKTFGEPYESICGVNMTPESILHGEKYNAVTTDAVLRLPHRVKVAPGDRIEVIKRYGEEIEPQAYVVDRYTNEGPSGGRAYLKATVVL